MSDYITGDPLLHILKSLPVNSLLRFRCVSKWWKATIDSDFFMREHLSLQKPQLLLAAYKKLDDFMVLDPQTLPLFRSLRPPNQHKGHSPDFGLIGTLHGVVCLFHKYHEFKLWNPATRDISVSIPLPESLKRYINFGFWLDPYDRSFKIIGFGLDMTGNYDKIVDAVLYSSITEEWTHVPLPEFMSKFVPLDDGPPVIVDGVAYWGEFEDWLLSSPMILLSFDFVLEIFGSVRVPNVSHSYRSLPIHCNLQGALSLVYWEGNDPHRCDIYSRQKDEWVKTFEFNFVAGINHVFWVGGTKESFRVIALNYRDLVVYEAKDGCIELKRRLKESVTMLMAYDFVESLFSLNGY